MLKPARWLADRTDSFRHPGFRGGRIVDFGMFCPAWKFRFDVAVPSIPDHAVLHPAPRWDTTAALSTTRTSRTPARRPCPVTCTAAVPTRRRAPLIWQVAAGVHDPHRQHRTRRRRCRPHRLRHRCQRGDQPRRV